jgi:spermidine/putrescine transport system ATP-binding protein
LLDEPLAALDLKLRQAMQLELKRIQRDTQVTFIFVTHDQQEALTMSDRIAVMSDGYVEQIGTPTDIYHRPATPFVAGFIGEANLLPGIVEGRQGEVATVAIAGGTITVPSPSDATGAVLVMVRPEKVQVARRAPVNGQAGVAATVDEVIFRGPTVHVGMTATDGTALVATLADDRPVAEIRPGDHAWALWDRDVAYLVPAVGGHSAAPPDPLEELNAPTDDGGT